MSTIRTTTLRSSELSCPSCVERIERELTAVEGVSSARVHFNSGRIVVQHDERRVPRQALVEAVAKAGYTAKVRVF